MNNNNKIKTMAKKYYKQPNNDITEDVIYNYSITNTIPYQLCPKCSGQGVVSKQPHIVDDIHQWESTSSSFVCDVCNGDKIIPMYKN